jgi:hypothetical protein
MQIIPLDSFQTPVSMKIFGLEIGLPQRPQKFISQDVEHGEYDQRIIALSPKAPHSVRVCGQDASGSPRCATISPGETLHWPMMMSEHLNFKWAD